METRQIDLLFLELSQVTKAETERELQLKSLLSKVLEAWKKDADCGDGIHEKDVPLFNRAMKKVNKTYVPL